ncbi:MAG TPA: class I SAM-dependent methyltransferase, partial [Thermomicrobiales bacterium]|nr:class I SAM-dependent methyltransferase [Thermomicrobiales bacterium]
MSESEPRTESDDVWDSGETYESYVGRWSRVVAREFLTWLAIPSGARWLDVGCGTGALTQTILALAKPAAVLGVDPSERYIAFAQRQIDDDRARFAIGDARALPVGEQSFDAAVSGLALNFVPAADHLSAVRGMVNAVLPGGTVAAYVWDYAGQMQFMRHFWDAAAVLDPAARALDEGRRFPICRPEPLAALFRAGALSDVVVRPIDIPTTFRDFDDYWSPFLGGQGPAPAYVASLTVDQQARLSARIRDGLP